MDRETDATPSPPERTVRPSEAHAELALREAAVLMAPLARWLLRHGVPYPAFADMLKSVFRRRRARRAALLRRQAHALGDQRAVRRASQGRARPADG
jgi:hypothetical protein